VRDAFIRALTRRASRDKGLYLITGDLGFSVFEDFITRYPGRFINAGIAEANMMGVASGLALAGKTAVVYSIIPFSVTRCLEQIKMDICYQNADVKIIGVGAGFAYGTLGASHHGIEDIAVMRGYPNMKIFAPCDRSETEACIDAALKAKGPCYIRLGKNRERDLLKRAVTAKAGGSRKLTEGRDAAILGTGSILGRALEAEKALRASGVKVRVVSMYSIKPIDRQAVLKAAADTGRMLTLEEHSVIGGLGSAVGEILAESGLKGVAFARMGIPDVFAGKIGGQGYLLDSYGLSVSRITDNVLRMCGKKTVDGKKRGSKT